MKAVAAFMSLVVIVLSLLPCSDHGDGAHDHQAHKSASITNIHHAEHSDILELCSPFCHCNCCQTSITFFSTDFKTIEAPGLGTTFTSFDDQMASQHHYSIWQPPNA